MTDQTPRYFPKFSHEYEAGPSGPARSYWDICYGTDASHCRITTLCLHPCGPDANPELTASSVCWELERARIDGQKDKARELRRALGVDQ